MSLRIVSESVTIASTARIVEENFTSDLREDLRRLNSGKPGAGATASAQTPSLGSNVDAALPQEDLGGGQSETAIAAANAGGQRRVLAAWNDASAFLQPDSTLPRGSGTGVGYSSDGGRHFRDLIGLPNANPDQEWVGDPSVVRIEVQTKHERGTASGIVIDTRGFVVTSNHVLEGAPAIHTTMPARAKGMSEIWPT
jgi:S1-C subfamily serine protease